MTCRRHVQAMLIWLLPLCFADYPAPPSNVRCASQSILGSLTVACEVNPSLTDMVSFMVARADDPERWPFFQYSVAVDAASNGTVVGALPHLQPRTAYLVMARSHERGQTTGYYVKWSDVTHFGGTCTMEAPGLQMEVAPRDAQTKAKTRWLDMYRHNGNNFWSAPDPFNNITLPDYLDAHNTADLLGGFASLGATVYKPDELNSSFTRYCVEIEDVDLPNITTVTDRTDKPELGGYPVTSNFADYVSCAGGHCFCMAYGDRRFRQPAKTLETLCPKCYPDGDITCMCECPASSLDVSLRYVGMIPTSTREVGDHVETFGRWYSLPSGGACAIGASVGDSGCTWRFSPLTYSFSLATAFERGIYKRTEQGGQGDPEAARKYFEELGAPPCGEGASASSLMVVV